jgi:hypothetical protein
MDTHPVKQQQNMAMPELRRSRFGFGAVAGFGSVAALAW